MQYKQLGLNRLFWCCDSHQVQCNLTENCPQSATFHTASR
jgi:hypothetical protein